MAALDTNVIVRFLVRDDEAQFAAAERLIRRCVSAGEPLFLPITVAPELEWVLRSNYGLAKDQVVRLLSGLLATVELSFESESALEMALRNWVDGNADFSDCVHAALAVQAAQVPLWTFDKATARLADAALLAR